MHLKERNVNTDTDLLLELRLACWKKGLWKGFFFHELSMFCLVQEPHDNVMSFGPYISGQLQCIWNKCGRDCSKIHWHIGFHREKVQEYREIFFILFNKVCIFVFFDGYMFWRSLFKKTKLLNKVSLSASKSSENIGVNVFVFFCFFRINPFLSVTTQNTIWKRVLM